MTVAEIVGESIVLLEAAGIEDARLEAEVLLAHALGFRRTRLLSELRSEVPPEAHKAFGALLMRRVEHEPLAYIVGYREFYGFDIVCGPGALIPRPETEMLVELVLSELAARGPGLRIVDVGSGTGAIAVAVCASARAARVVAIEASGEALAVARSNVSRHAVAGRMELRAGDLLTGVTAEFDVIAANLPYVPEADWAALPPEIRVHEPREALVGGPEGTEIIEELLSQAPARLAPGGVVVAEMGDGQAARLVVAATRFFPEADVCVKNDLSGRDRVLELRDRRNG